jgi:flavin reductase (DIM6/NTAB) family NADH-FMN oxidoreductase RutF
VSISSKASPAGLGGPPDTANEPLEIGVGDWEPRDIYFLHTSLIVPRPIAWVSTLSADGVPNLAPFSYFNAICDEPPMVMFVCDGEKNTYFNVRDTGEFVVNLASTDLAHRLDTTSIDFPAAEDEFAWANVNREPSRTIRPPRVAEAPAALECRLDRIIDVGIYSHIIFGFVAHYRLHHSIWSKGRVNPQLLRPLARLAGRYATIQPEFKIDRPTLDEAMKAGREAVSAQAARNDGEFR